MNRLLLVLFLIWSGFARSETLYSDFVFVMKNVDFIETLPKSIRGSHFDQIEDIQIKEPLNTKIEGITYSLAYSVEYNLEQLNLGKFPVRVVIENFNLNIQKIITDDIIEKQRGNILLRTRVQGQCKKLNITSKDSNLAVNANVALVDKAGLFNPSIRLENIDLSTELDIFVDSCEGFKDYENELREAIFSWIKEESDVIKDTEKQVQQAFRQKVQEALAVALKTQEETLLENGKVTLIPYYLKAHTNGKDLFVHGRIFAQMDNQISRIEYIPMQINPFQLPNSSSLILSLDYLKKLSSLVYRNGGYLKDFYSQEIPALRDLHQNRFAQAFVFPDMSNFPTNANFVLRSYLVQDPTMNFTQGQEQLMARIVSRARIDNWVPRDGEYQKQLSINSNFEVDASVKILGNQLILDFGEPNFDLQGVWDNDYIAKYDPNTFVDLSRFREGIESSLSDLDFEFTLPELKLRIDKKMGPDFIELKQNYIFINYVQK